MGVLSILLTALTGAAIGGGVGFVLALGAEFLSCISCGDCGMKDGTPLLLYCAIIGAVIGLIIGLVAMKADADKKAAEEKERLSEEARKLRVNQAAEVKQLASKLCNTCRENRSANRPLVSTTYKADMQMTEIINELTMAAEKQGKVDSLAEELSEKGGTIL